MSDKVNKAIEAISALAGVLASGPAAAGLSVLLQIASGLNKKVTETIKADPEAFKAIQAEHVDDYVDSVAKMREQFKNH
jgi:hypothetical protein